MTNEKRLTMLFTASPAKQAEVDSILLGKSVAVPLKEARKAAITKHEEKAETRLCTFAEAARRLNLSKSTLYALVRDGRLETVKVNKVSRIPLAAVVTFANGKEA